MRYQIKNASSAEEIIKAFCSVGIAPTVDTIEGKYIIAVKANIPTDCYNDRYVLFYVLTKILTHTFEKKGKMTKWIFTTKNYTLYWWTE